MVPPVPRPSIQLFELLRPHLPALAGGLVCLALLAAANALYAYITGPLLRVLLTGGAGGFEMLEPFLGPISGGQPGVGAVAMFLVGLAALKGFAHLGQAVLLDGASERVGHRMRVALYDHLMRMPLAAHRQHAAGDLLARLLDDVRRVQEASVGAAVALLREGLGAVALLVVAIIMAPGLTLAAVVVVPVVALAVAGLSRGVKRAAARLQRQAGRMAARASGGLAALREVKSCGAEERQVAGLAEHSRGVRRWAIRAIAIRALSPLVNEVMAGVALGGTLLYAGQRLADRTLAPENVVSFFVAAVMLYRPVKGLSGAAQQWAGGRASLERVAEIWQLARERDDGGPPLPRLRRAVRLECVGFSYEQGPPVLSGVNLDLPVGRVTALVGPSGAGKSTLANVVCGLERPTEGRIIWDGEDVTARGAAALRRGAALVPQQPLVLDGTVGENLRLAAPGAAEDDVLAAAKAAGIWRRIQALHRVLETRLGEGGIQLSAGETQRLAVARALLKGSGLLVLDEPSSALDAENEAHLAATLREIGRDHAVLLVTHSPGMLAAAGAVLRLEGATVVPEADDA